MTEKQFDEFFRKKLGDHSSEVPEDMWQRIKRKKDKDRTIVILFLLLLLLTGGATSYFIFSTKNAKENVELSQKHVDKNPGNKASLNQNKKQELNNTQNDTVNAKQDKNPIIPGKTVLNSEAISIKSNDQKRNINKNYRDNGKQENRKSVYSDEFEISKLSPSNFADNDSDSLTNNFSNQLSKSNEEIAVKKLSEKSSS